MPPEMPEMTDLRYNGSCIRCHMVHEAQYHRQRKAGTFTARSLWLYPLPDNVGIKLDAKLGNLINEIVADSFAAKAGLQPGDRIRSANGSRIVTVSDLQFLLNGLEAKSKLTVNVERDGKPVDIRAGTGRRLAADRSVMAQERSLDDLATIGVHAIPAGVAGRREDQARHRGGEFRFSRCPGIRRTPKRRACARTT